MESFNFDTELLQLAVVGWAREVENLCAPFHVAAGASESLNDRLALDFVHVEQRRNNKFSAIDLCILEIFRKTARQENVTRTKQNCSLDNALKFAYVAGPIIPNQAHDRFRG